MTATEALSLTTQDNGNVRISEELRTIKSMALNGFGFWLSKPLVVGKVNELRQLGYKVELIAVGKEMMHMIKWGEQ